MKDPDKQIHDKLKGIIKTALKVAVITLGAVAIKEGVRKIKQKLSNS